VSPTEAWAGRAVESAQRGANALLLVNAGGAVAVMALLPALLEPETTSLLSAAMRSLNLLGWGTAAAALLHVLVYAVTRLDFEASRGSAAPRVSDALFWTAALAALGSLGLFVAASRGIAGAAA
jgi:hypothetical protein